MILFFLFILSSISIDVRQDKEALLLDETLTVNYTLHYSDTAPPNLFSFLYNLNEAPLSTFEIVSSSVNQPNSTTTELTFTLAPLSTGELLFAPGVLRFGNVDYLLPPVKAQGLSAGLAALPIARSLPLYPERRIELNPEMRLKLMSQEVLQKAQEELVISYESHYQAWALVLLALIGMPFTLLFLWGLIYFELLQRGLRPKPKKPTQLQRLLAEVAEPNWQKLSQLLKEGLSTIEGGDMRFLDLVEIRLKVAESLKFTPDVRDELLRFLDELEVNCYTPKELSKEEWQNAHDFVLKFLKEHLFDKSHHN